MTKTNGSQKVCEHYASIVSFWNFVKTAANEENINISCYKVVFHVQSSEKVAPRTNQPVTEQDFPCMLMVCA